MAPGLVGVLTAAAPQLFNLWQGMDAKSQRQLLEVGKMFLPMAGLPTEVASKVKTVMDDDTHLMAKFSTLASDPSVVDAIQNRTAPPAKEQTEYAVTCPNCKQIKYIQI